ncbi:hypothetical protein CC86DRAFT_137062 [Ophiobolus disseminans]|uniref:Uncharacterized protein n=1 Tax=Ophiobolus disseminans TaxID=1469910 RepID=A0A6A7ADD2_9PLEO|nr:hypothetical protein CC86DRAFT_137062 [Ophiobolus disseminans]
MMNRRRVSYAYTQDHTGTPSAAAAGSIGHGGPWYGPLPRRSLRASHFISVLRCDSSQKRQREAALESADVILSFVLSVFCSLHACFNHLSPRILRVSRKSLPSYQSEATHSSHANKISYHNSTSN